MRALEAIVKLPRLHAAQERVLREARRYNVLACGRRWGKTTLLMDIAINAALEGKRVGWFAPIYALLEEAYIGMRTTLGQAVSSAAQSPHPRLQLWTGGVVEFWTLEDPLKPGRGRAYHMVIIDEAAFARRLMEAWEQSISPTLTDYRGVAWFASTPKGYNAFYELWRRGQGEDPEWMSWRMSTAMNPHISREELEARRRAVSAKVWLQEYEAEFVDLGGSVFQREWIRYGEPPPREKLRIYQGVDLAISTRQDGDYTAIVTVGKDDDGRIWVLDAVRHRGPFHTVLQLIRHQADRWQPERIAIEAVQYQVAVIHELMRTTTLPVFPVRPDKDKVTRFLPLSARYQQGLVWHVPNLSREFEQELIEFPTGRHDDQVDALVYAFMAEGIAVGLSPEDQRRYAAT